MSDQTVFVVGPYGKKTLKKLSLDATLDEIWVTLGELS